MASVSSHILDSVSGRSASGIRCTLYRIDGDAGKQLLFDVRADHEGRIVESVELDVEYAASEYELVFYAAAYFCGRSLAGDSMVETVVIRFRMDDAQRRYHLPLMLSPHSYSTWWSS